MVQAFIKFYERLIKKYFQGAFPPDVAMSPHTAVIDIIYDCRKELQHKSFYWDNIMVNHQERGTIMFEQYEEVVTPQELSEMLRIGMNQTYKILNDGLISAYREGKSWRISKQSVIEYINKRSKQG